MMLKSKHLWAKRTAEKTEERRFQSHLEVNAATENRLHESSSSFRQPSNTNFSTQASEPAGKSAGGLGSA